MALPKSVKAKLEGMKKQGIYLVVAKAADYEDVNYAVVEYLVNKMKMNGVYVTLNKPFSTMKNIFKERKIPIDKVMFLDGISKTIIGETTPDKNVQYVESPESLTDLSIAVNLMASQISPPRFLFFDSLSTLLVYNASGPVTKFAHFLIGRMRKWEINGVIVSIEEETDSKLYGEISQFCDGVIKV